MEFNELLINLWSILNMMDDAKADRFSANFLYKGRPAEVKIKLGKEEPQE